MSDNDEVALALRDGSQSADSTSIAPLKLAIFDVDGTLSTGGMFTKCLGISLEEVLGIKGVKEILDAQVMGGSSPRQGIMSIISQAGVPEERQEEAFNAAISTAKKILELEMQKSPLTVYPGVRELLELLSQRDDWIIAVATNNFSDVTKTKLASTGLLELFERNGIIESGENITTKADAVRAAIRAAEEKLGVEFNANSVFFFGDQTSDIRAGKSVGIVTVGVGTGKSSLDELLGAEPDIVLSDLSNTKTVMALIERRSINAGVIKGKGAKISSI